ncbi:CZB domain-containing protein [Thiomonas intermedia]|uniref:CZB domain-containing protein n=1 Tax=Thiomonas intermedia TaxID=926 RepID=UPI0009A4BA10|nr:CZB domain-containing protein [Thiomonas intermedia]
MDLNFFSATNAHKAWKKRLHDCVSGSGNTLDPAVIALDNRCDLGKWLYGIRDSRPALSTDTSQLFTRLFDEHAAFHRVAAGVVQQAMTHQQKEALQQLQAGGDYARISNQVIGTLGELYLKRREFGMD